MVQCDYECYVGPYNWCDLSDNPCIKHEENGTACQEWNELQEELENEIA